MTDTLKLSFVIPLCNEEATIGPLFEQIQEVVQTNKLGSFEVIFIDDGSDDDSWSKLTELKAKYGSLIQLIRFRRNQGKAAALDTGFRKASGEIVFTIDADLQDDPQEIPAFIEKLDEGYDLVSGWKQHRKDPLGKTLPSRFFNWATRAASGVKLNDFNCGFKAYRSDALADINLYGELHRYIPVLVAASGYTIAEIPVKHHERTHGVSKYGWKRLFKGGLDLMTVILLTRYLRRPGHFFGGLGLLCGSLGFTILLILSIQKIVWSMHIGARPLFFLGILLMLLGFQLVSTGLLAELIQGNRSIAKPPQRTLKDY